MLSRLRHYHHVRACIEVLADAIRYILMMLVVVVLLGQLASRAL